jgi:hypothetical protein
MKRHLNFCILFILIGWCSGAYAQKTVTGIVMDERSEEIVGASVVVKGTTIGTISDISGKFSIRVPEKGTLVISYIGYQTQEIPIGNETNLQIRLKEDAEQLEEVVVVGYGTQRKETLTGAVTASGLQISEAMPVRPLHSCFFVNFSVECIESQVFVAELNVNRSEGAAAHAFGRQRDNRVCQK